MRKALIVAGIVLVGFFVVKSCGENPEKSAQNTVKEFIGAVRDEEGKEAVKLLYPPFRDALVMDLKLPVQLTEMKPSEVLACVLSSMGSNIKKVKYLDSKRIDDKHVEVLVRVIDKEGVDKVFTFIVIKDEKKWRIASISSVSK